MKKTIFAANLPEDVNEDDLRGVFSAVGDVEHVEWTRHPKHGMQYALVEMNNEKSATKARNRLNGYRLKDRYLAVTPPDLGDRDKLSNKQRKVYDKVVSELQESEKIPLRQIEAIIMLCGTNFVEALLKETEEIEANGGIMTTDGKRRRTKGGVFFYLARFRMSRELRRIVYNRKGQMPDPDATPNPQPQQPALEVTDAPMSKATGSNPPQDANTVQAKQQQVTEQQAARDQAEAAAQQQAERNLQAQQQAAQSQVTQQQAQRTQRQAASEPSIGSDSTGVTAAKPKRLSAKQRLAQKRKAKRATNTNTDTDTEPDTDTDDH